MRAGSSDFSLLTYSRIILFPFFFLLLQLFAYRLPRHRTEPISDGLVGYWAMDEPVWVVDCTTPSVRDSSGTGVHGRACPAGIGPAGGVAGTVGRAGDFDGQDDYVIVPDSSALDRATAFTIAVWIKPDGVADGGVILEKGEGETTYRLGINPTGVSPEHVPYVMMEDATSTNFKVAATTALTDGVWYALRGTWDGATVRISGDGTEEKPLRRPVPSHRTLIPASCCWGQPGRRPAAGNSTSSTA